MSERYIQLFNAANQPFFVGMETGRASWLIPVREISQLSFMAHLTDDSKCYYEELTTQEVSWKLPFTQMTPAAANTCKVLPGCNEEDTAEWIDEDFPEDKSIELMFAIDAYLLEGGQDGGSSGEEEEATEEISAAVLEKQPSGVLDSIFSANSKKQNYSDNEAEDPNSGGYDDMLVGEDLKMVEEESGSEDGSESGSGGTAETDEDFYAKKSPQENANPSLLTVESILSQNTIKVLKIFPTTSINVSFKEFTYCIFHIGILNYRRRL